MARNTGAGEEHWSDYVAAAVVRDAIRLTPAEVRQQQQGGSMNTTTETQECSCNGCQQYFGRSFAHPLVTDGLWSTAFQRQPEPDETLAHKESVVQIAVAVRELQVGMALLEGDVMASDASRLSQEQIAALAEAHVSLTMIAATVQSLLDAAAAER